MSRGIDILAEVISRPELKHWEIDDARPRLEFDLNVYDERPELSKRFLNRKYSSFQTLKV